MSVIWDRPRRMKGPLKCWCRCFTRISTSSLRDRLGARRAFNGLRRDATATEDESVIGRTCCRAAGGAGAGDRGVERGGGESRGASLGIGGRGAVLEERLEARRFQHGLRRDAAATFPRSGRGTGSLLRRVSRGSAFQQFCCSDLVSCESDSIAATGDRR